MRADESFAHHVSLHLSVALPSISDAHYLTCRIQECAETTRSGPFARSIDISSLVVQDEYIFIQVSSERAVGGGRCIGEVSCLLGK